MPDINRFFILIAILAVLSASAAAKTEYDGSRLRIDLFIDYKTGSSFYNTDTDLIVEITEDTTSYDEYRSYTFERRRYMLGLAAEYLASDRLRLFAELPFAYHTLNEKFREKKLGESVIQLREDRGNFDLFRIEYLFAGAKYRLFGQQARLDAKAAVFIPSGFHTEADSLKYDFLGDGAFQFIAGAAFTYREVKYWFNAEAYYNYRAEAYSDQMVFMLGGGLSTVPRTRLSGDVRYVHSLGTFDDAVKFDPRRYTLAENFLEVGFGFSILLSREIETGFRYDIRLLGKNSLNTGRFRFTAGYYF